ncbi:MAG TPA: DUF262 domain-containing protein [bacterium]|jgi:hypothetical protein
MKKKKKIEEQEQNLQYEEDMAELPPPDIVAFNELRSCADLYRMVESGNLEIQPEFQRDVIWKLPDQTRFIDSLVKALPIPSMCFSLDYKTRKWQVIDGLQRMATIKNFLSGEMQSLSRLDDIDQKLSGKEVKLFHDKESKLYSYLERVENLTLPITVLRCDYSKENHKRYLFMIFHRLNTGGTKLNNQEIRNCIYSGSFNDLIKELDQNDFWRKINKMKPNESYRFTKQEIILRMFALQDNLKNYKGRLASFLNKYMDDHQTEDKRFLNRKKIIFEQTVKILYQDVFSEDPPKITVTVLEALLVGISKNLKILEVMSTQSIKTRYQQLLSHEEFSDERLSEGLSGKARVIGRLAAAIDIFGD